MKLNYLILVSLSIMLIFSYGIGVGRYKWFPYTEISKAFYIIKDISENSTHNARQNETQIQTSSKDAFAFIAYGDNPYVPENDVESVMSGLLKSINKESPSLIVHVGDTFGGQPCTNSMIDLQREMMNKLNAPVLYSPGDNEWRDCVDKTKGNTHNLERLSYIRETYFSNKQTLGKISDLVESQSERGYPENVRLMKNNILFITAHVVGSKNNFDPMSKQNTMEFFERDAANIDWITESFSKNKDASAFVVAIHADMFQPKPSHAGIHQPKPPFKNFSNVLNQLSNKYKKPVLILFGDSHVFKTFKPSPRKYPFINAIEVYGWPDLKAIKVKVDVSQETPFRVIKIISSK
jgi:hypothetical protein